MLVLVFSNIFTEDLKEILPKVGKRIKIASKMMLLKISKLEVKC